MAIWKSIDSKAEKAKVINMKEMNIKFGVYTYNDKEKGFNFKTSLRASGKLQFVNSVANLVIDDNYNSIIRDLAFNIVVIQMFSDINFSELNDGQEATLDQIEDFILETNVVPVIKENMDKGLWEELNGAVDKAIEYKTGIHPNPVAEALGKLMSTLESQISNMDMNSLMKAAQQISDMSHEFTPDKILEAYSKSDIFKDKYKKILAAREKRNVEPEYVAAMDTIQREGGQ